MTYSKDLRWRAIVLHHVYGIPIGDVSLLLGPKPRSINRWYKMFLKDGVVMEDAPREKSARWLAAALAAFLEYVPVRRTFYIDELQQHIRSTFPDIQSTSSSTICRVLNVDLNMSRKVLTKAAREAVPDEIAVYLAKLRAIDSFPEQLLFLDETSNDGRHAYRRYAWSARNTKAVVRLPFRRGKRASILAAFNATGFVARDTTEGTCSRREFHSCFVRKVVPLLNPWPLPRSIVILDNAKIHMYPELEAVVHQCGARLLFLPPYCPQLNPIELGFGLIKKLIQRHANLIFPLYPKQVLETAMPLCTKTKSTGSNMFKHCGYDSHSLQDQIFTDLMGAEKKK